MGRSRIARFVKKAGVEFEKKAEEFRLNPPPPEPVTQAPREPVHHSRIPKILSIHRQLNRIRNEISYLEAKTPNSRKIHTLKAHYRKLDALLMLKLKNE